MSDNKLNKSQKLTILFHPSPALVFPKVLSFPFRRTKDMTECMWQKVFC